MHSANSIQLIPYLPGLTHQPYCAQEGEEIPEAMQRYEALGAPEVAVIAQHCLIRFQQIVRAVPAAGECLIENLLEQKGI